MNREIRDVMDFFERISAIPRCSKKEDKIAAWVEEWADGKGFAHKKDQAGNLLISVPASEGAEAAPTVVLQGHMDMVCEKTPDSHHDFSKDPVELVYENEKLRAKKTSLGADNGIGLALAMAAASNDSSPRPALELLFTVDEETGLTGAGKLEPGWLSGKVLLNIDSENDEVFTVGCAGGLDTVVELPVSLEEIPAKMQNYTLKVGGLKGGHSGIDIHEQRANAIKLLSRVLLSLLEKSGARAVAVSGGSARNAIPRQATAELALSSEDVSSVLDTVREFEKKVRSEFEKIEPDLKISLEKSGNGNRPSETMSRADALKAVRLLNAIPHGVYNMSYDIAGLVETSNNLATVATGNGSVKIATSQRSSVMSRLVEITDNIKAAAKLAGARCKDENGYPAWSPDLDSPLLSKCVGIYEKLNGNKPEIKAIHAGLECGVIGAKYPGMDMISFGPDIEGAHSPDETLDLASVKKIKDFLAALLGACAS